MFSLPSKCVLLKVKLSIDIKSVRWIPRCLEWLAKASWKLTGCEMSSVHPIRGLFVWWMWIVLAALGSLGGDEVSSQMGVIVGFIKNIHYRHLG